MITPSKTLANPLNEAVTNRDGIAYVLSRMNWYWNLVPLLENTPEISAGLEGQLEVHIIDLYKDLLSYQMRSACLYYKNRVFVILRDVARLDEWQSTLESIKPSESEIRHDLDIFTKNEVTSRLDVLVRSSESVCLILRQTMEVQKSAQGTRLDT